MSKVKNHNVVILGSGLSGLMTAFELAKKNIHSLVLSKGELIQTNTWKAQGGVAAAVSKVDSIEKHLKDTLDAGDGLCNAESVEKILGLGPKLISELIEEGMTFDHNGKKISLGKEGGHHERRILHVDDKTGQALHEFLIHKLLDGPYKNFVTLLSKTMIQSATQKNGEFILQGYQSQTKEEIEIQCSHLVLATGGAGKAFLYTSNWEGATGDGLKLAHDLGATLKNLEMVQFHPTCLFHSQSKNFLITEALRGEGAKLVNHKGERFAHNSHPDAELAPRDIVSRAIEREIKRSGRDCVFLDITDKSRHYLKERFPTIYERCLSLGIDISEQKIPVVPAAHYTCGGIDTKEDLVSTDVKNLFAVGECGHTGLHGANRLASNSLLECLATAYLCAKKIQTAKESPSCSLVYKENYRTSLSERSSFLSNALWEESRNIMWNYVGIQRSNEMLDEALKKVLLIEEKSQNLGGEKPDKDFSELRNVIFFSKFCILSALKRNESRGCHYKKDFPQKSEQLYNTKVSGNLVSRENILEEDL